MSEQVCVTDGCDRPAFDAFVCTNCGDLLSQALGDVTALSEELDVTLSRQTGKAYRIGGKSDDTPLPYHEGARDARIVLRSTLVAWVRELVGEDEQWPKDTLPDISRWLLASVEDIRQREDGGEAVDEIGSAVRHARRAIDRAAERVYAGPCEERAGCTGEGCPCPCRFDGKRLPECAVFGCDTKCGADLYAKLGASMVRCRECGAEYDVQARRQWLLRSAEDHLATLPDITRAIPGLVDATLGTSTLRQWKRRGRLIARSVDLNGVETYRIGDVLDLMGRSPHVDLQERAV